MDALLAKKELEDFKGKFGQDMELRDLLNKERGLTRRKSKPITKDVDENIKGMSMSKAESDDVASRLYKPSGRLNSEENMNTSDMAYNKRVEPSRWLKVVQPPLAQMGVALRVKPVERWCNYDVKSRYGRYQRL